MLGFDPTDPHNESKSQRVKEQKSQSQRARVKEPKTDLIKVSDSSQLPTTSLRQSFIKTCCLPPELRSVVQLDQFGCPFIWASHLDQSP